MKVADTLKSERLILKPLGLAHLSENYVNWMNDPLVNKYLESGGNYTLELLKEYLTDVEANNILFWAIHLKSDFKHIGNIKIDPINKKHGFGEYGILMGDRQEWKKGFAKEASQLVLDFCFSSVGLRKINLGVVPENENAVKLYNNLGFILEGTYKRHFFYNNRYYDCYRMAVFSPEFL